MGTHLLAPGAGGGQALHTDTSAAPAAALQVTYGCHRQGQLQFPGPPSGVPGCCVGSLDLPHLLCCADRIIYLGPRAPGSPVVCRDQKNMPG
jgi:hypothetical protein